MAVIVWKDGVSSRVEAHALQRHLKAGYTLKNEPVVAAVEKPAEIDMDLDQARLAYADKFGEKPHHKMKFETILEKLNGNESV